MGCGMGKSELQMKKCDRGVAFNKTSVVDSHAIEFP